MQAAARLLAAVVISLLATRAAHAQELPPQEAPPEPEKDEKRLGPHDFPVPVFMPWAFITTHFSMRQGVMQVSVPSFAITQNRSIDASLIGANEKLQVGVQFARRVEVFIDGSGQALMGSGADSLLTLGTNYSYQLGGGAGVRLFRLENTNTQMTLRARFNYDSGGSAQILRMLEAFQDQAQTLEELLVSDSRRVIVQDSSRTEFAAYALGSQAIGRNFGVQAAVGLSRQRLIITAYDLDQEKDIDTEKQDWEPQGTIGVDANIQPLAPLAFSTEYQVRTGQQDFVAGTDGGTRVSHLIALSLHYLHRNFQISLTGARALHLEPVTREIRGQEYTSGAPAVTYGQLAIHTFW